MSLSARSSVERSGVLRSVDVETRLGRDGYDGQNKREHQPPDVLVTWASLFAVVPWMAAQWATHSRRRWACGVPSKGRSMTINGCFLTKGMACGNEAGYATIQRAFEIAAKAETVTNPSIRTFLDEQAKALMREARTHLDKSEPFVAAVRAVFREFGLPY